MTNVLTLIKQPKAKVFRRCYIKRRDATTGLYETDWHEITEDIEKWGKLKSAIDVEKPGRFKFNNNKIKLSNDKGKYNTEDDPGSLWFGYAPQQRTLVKINYGFIHQTLSSSGIWKNYEYPNSVLFDEVEFDDAFSLFENHIPSWRGLISSDIPADDSNSIAFDLKPLTQVFMDYPVDRIDWNTATGITASRFIELVRDQTDGSGHFIFRPFFDDTTTTWDISTTSISYSELTSGNVGDNTEKSVWDVIEKLCQAENFIAYVDNNGVFRFNSRTGASTTSFKFCGIGYSDDTEYGITIKKISKYGQNIGAFYSRINVKFADDDTTTSYVTKDIDMVVDGANSAWNYGYKIFNLENTWIPDTATAQTIADALYTDLSIVKKEIEFTTSFVPQLNILDQFEVYYTTSKITGFNTLWDRADWDNELVWDKISGDALKLNGTEFRIIEMEIDLDKFECKFKGR